MHTKILVLTFVAALLLIGCGPGKGGCRWWDTDCPDSPYSETSTTSNTFSVESCVEACDGDLVCEDECVSDPVP